MTEQEIIAKEAFKIAMKQAIMSNPYLTDSQKQQAVQKIEIAALKADFVIWVLRQCGFVV